MYLLAIPMALAGQAAPVAAAAAPVKAVANCLVRKQDGAGRSVGEELTLGWQFDPAKTGMVDRAATRLYDPSGIVGGREIDQVDRGDQLTFWVPTAKDRDRAAALTLILTKAQAPEPEVFNVAVGKVVAGSPKMTHFGTCYVAAYDQRSADLMFEALKQPQATSK